MPTRLGKKDEDNLVVLQVVVVGLGVCAVGCAHVCRLTRVRHGLQHPEHDLMIFVEFAYGFSIGREGGWGGQKRAKRQTKSQSNMNFTVNLG